MANLKIEYLLKNVGFSLTELNMERKLELELMMDTYGEEWVLLALSKKPVENWNQYGFALFNNDKFKASITAINNAFKKIKDEDIQKEYDRQKKAKSEKEAKYKQSHVQANFNLLKGIDGAEWNYVLPNGGLVSPNELYRLNEVPQSIQDLEILKVSDRGVEDLTERECWLLCLCIRKIKYIDNNNVKSLEGRERSWIF